MAVDKQIILNRDILGVLTKLTRLKNSIDLPKKCRDRLSAGLIEERESQCWIKKYWLLMMRNL